MRKPRIVFAGSVPQSDYWAATLIKPECAIERFLSLLDHNQTAKQTRSSSNSRVKLCQRSRIICSEPQGSPVHPAATVPQTEAAYHYKAQIDLATCTLDIRRPGLGEITLSAECHCSKA
jgi:hypothetical protein